MLERQPAGATRQYRMSARAAAASANGVRMLEAARRQFGEVRYDRVSLDDIAAEAGVTVRTVVRRFGSKEGLFAAVAMERGASIRRARDETPAGDVPEAVRVLVGTYDCTGSGPITNPVQDQSPYSARNNHESRPASITV